MARLGAPLHIKPCLACGRTAKSSCTNRFVFCSIRCRNKFTDFVENLSKKEKQYILEKVQCELCPSGH